MSARNAKQTEKIVKDRLPGYKLSESSSKYRESSARSRTAAAAGVDTRGRTRTARVDSSTPSIAELRRKFLRPAADSDTVTEAADFSGEDDADIVLVEPTKGGGGRQHTKAIVIDGEGRILGAQG